MPDDFDRSLRVAVFDGSEITQEIILLGRIVVQPANHVVHLRRIHVDHSLAPDHFHVLDGGREFVPQRFRGWIRFGASMHDVFLGGGLSARRAGARSDDFESAHSPDLVWLTELPKGSPSSSITEGGMYS